MHRIFAMTKIFAFMLALFGCSKREEQPDVEYTMADHNRLWEEGLALIDPYMRLDDKPEKPTNNRHAIRDIEEGIEKLSAVVELKPANWAALWVIGKAYQALERPEDACNSFARSFEIEKENADVAREYMLSCLQLGRFENAVSVAEHAASLEPDEAGLIANVALALVLAGRTEDALKKTEESLAINPRDSITQALNKRIHEIIDGSRPQPKSIAELESR